MPETEACLLLLITARLERPRSTAVVVKTVFHLGSAAALEALLRGLATATSVMALGLRHRRGLPVGVVNRRTTVSNLVVTVNLSLDHQRLPGSSRAHTNHRIRLLGIVAMASSPVDTVRVDSALAVMVITSLRRLGLRTME